MPTSIALTIAGSDSGGGAGIQADLKTFSALGVYGASVITAVTAQNTRAVTAVEAISPALIRAQIEAVFADLPPQAVKTGMLGDSQTICTVADSLAAVALPYLVIDPVMVAKSGDKLLADAAIATLRERLIPLATLITPNLPEAGELLGRPVITRDDMPQAAADLLALGCHAVLLKGGHLAGDASDDLLLTTGGATWLSAARHPGKSTAPAAPCRLPSPPVSHAAWRSLTPYMRLRTTSVPPLPPPTACMSAAVMVRCTTSTAGGDALNRQ